MRTVVFGFDPGLKGGVAVFDCEQGRFSDVVSMPVNDDGIDTRVLKTFLLKCKMKFPESKYIAVIEKVGAMPGQGVVSMFTFGEGYGSLKTAVSYALHTDIISVTPQTWKKTVLSGYEWKQSVPKLVIPKGTSAEKAKEMKKAHNREKTQAKARGKAVAMQFLHDKFPYVNLKRGHKVEQDGLADACCVALYGAILNNFKINA